MKSSPKFVLAAVLAACIGAGFAATPGHLTGYRAASDFWGSRYVLSKAAPSPTPKPANKKERDAIQRLRHWNQTAIDASGLDHTPVAPGENRVFGEQVGPVRAARAIAIVQIAVFEAVNAIDGHCRSYL